MDIDPINLTLVSSGTLSLNGEHLIDLSDALGRNIVSGSLICASEQPQTGKALLLNIP